MSDTEPFIGQIQILAFNFAPVGYALCNGQLLSINQYTALFSLIGTTYGGDGQTTFALPNLQGRAPVHMGQLAGGQNYTQGQVSGVENVSLLTSNLPPHIHGFVGGTSTLNAVAAKAMSQSPTAGGFLARGADENGTDTPQIYVPAGTAGDTVALAGVNVVGTVTPTGNNVPFSVLQPLLVLNYSIALEGIFPTRN